MFDIRSINPPTKRKDKPELRVISARTCSAITNVLISFIFLLTISQSLVLSVSRRWCLPKLEQKFSVAR